MKLPVFQRTPTNSLCITKQRGGNHIQKLLDVFLVKRQIFKTSRNIKMINTFCLLLIVSASRFARICCLE